jgi:hypothetical protein
MVRGTEPIEPVTSNSTMIGVDSGCSGESRDSRTRTAYGSMLGWARQQSRGREDRSAL